jgi:hypothetical protein
MILFFCPVGLAIQIYCFTHYTCLWRQCKISSGARSPKDLAGSRPRPRELFAIQREGDTDPGARWHPRRASCFQGAPPVKLVKRSTFSAAGGLAGGFRQGARSSRTRSGARPATCLPKPPRPLASPYRLEPQGICAQCGATMSVHPQGLQKEILLPRGLPESRPSAPPPHCRGPGSGDRRREIREPAEWNRRLTSFAAGREDVSDPEALKMPPFPWERNGEAPAP